MQKGVILFFFFIFFQISFSFAEQINFDDFNYLKLKKINKRFNISYLCKIIQKNGVEYSSRSMVDVSDEKKFYLKNENLVGGGFLELDLNGEKVTVKKMSFKNDILQENIVQANKHFYSLRDKSIIEWISFHRKYLKYFIFEEDIIENSKELSEYKIKKLNPSNLSGNTNSNKALKVEGTLILYTKFKIPKDYHFKIFFEDGMEILFSVQVII